MVLSIIFSRFAKRDRSGMLLSCFYSKSKLGVLSSSALMFRGDYELSNMVTTSLRFSF